MRMSEITHLISKCRLCLQCFEELEMHSFFSACLEELSLAEIFTNITSFKVEENDAFPKKICSPCKTNIISFKSMILAFQDTERFLKTQLFKKEVNNADEHCFINKKKMPNEFNSGISDLDSNDDIFKEEVDDFQDENSIPDKNIINNKDISDYINSSKLNSINLPKIQRLELDERVICRQRKKQSELNNVISDNLEYSHVSSYKYTCDCGDCFLHKSGFRQHMQYKHNVLLEEGDFEKYSEEIKIKIPVGFPNNMELVSSKITVRKKNLQCRMCDTTFLTEEEIKEHEEIHKTFICDHCGAAFLKKNYLADHLRIHSEERRYTCKICQKTFKHRYTYSVHKRSHDITRDFVCETCGACFKTRGTMRTHIRIKHSNVRNYCCPNCNLRFNLKSTLDKHFMRKHTPDRKKSFVCTKCGSAYLNKNTLTRHVAEKHLGKVKYFPCTICENKMYVMKKGLRSHMLKKHGIVYQ